MRAGWDEIRDSVWDAGGEWPDGSARQIGDRVADGLPDEAAQAMRRVALEERGRYAQALGDVDLCPADDVRRFGWVWSMEVARGGGRSGHVRCGAG
ncbi:MAG: hypothetical protein R2719_08895 [Micropruina sp.]